MSQKIHQEMTHESKIPGYATTAISTNYLIGLVMSAVNGPQMLDYMAQ
jgi:hypothetical protein